MGQISAGVVNNLIVGKAEVDWEMRPVQDRDAKFVKTALAEYVEAELRPSVGWAVSNRRKSPMNTLCWIS
ncbi:MAG: peptidase dimerization domain-containing protein [Paracoccaceae bacterium]|nr:peptidase dimerization domain-containing protein [Paracoccaceae bacterium]